MDPWEPFDEDETKVGRKLALRLISGIPDDEVVWRSSDGPVTAGRLRTAMTTGEDWAREYFSDVMKIARDFARRRSQKPVLDSGKDSDSC